MHTDHPVLVIDDDVDLRCTICDALELEGYLPVGVANGAEALAWLAEGNRPCVILLDLMMPVMDGWSFRAAQLANAELARIPVVVMSAQAKMARQPIDAPVLLDKPIELRRLTATVEEFCEVA